MSFGRGSSVAFGRYYVRNKTDREPVLWTVIAEKADEVLLLANHILTFRTFNNLPSYNENPNWSDSALRKWLNEKLCAELFESNVRNFIKPHSYSTKSNGIIQQNQSIDSGNKPKEIITEDVLSLLSWEECIAYFNFDPENKMRQIVYENMKERGISSEIYDVLLSKKGLKTDALPIARSSATTRSALTRHYSGKGYDDNQSTYFWLRSPGCNPNTFVYSYDGLVNREGKECNEVLGVRPIMWISKTTLDYVTKNGEYK